MSAIKYLVFDVDNTLLDFGLSLIRSQKVVADRIGVEFSEEYFRADQELMDEAWNEFRMDDTNDREIQEYWHLHYRMQVLRQYEMLGRRLGIDCDPCELMRIRFESISGMHYTMEPETLDVFRELSGTYRNVLATNSVTETRDRLSIFEPYCYRIFLSDEIHAIKPTATFFNTMLRSLECAPEECLMIGDSATDDMGGGKRAGLRTCWYKRGKGNRVCSAADYSIESITELPALLERIAGGLPPANRGGET